MEKVRWSDRLRREVAHIFKEERNIVRKMKRRKVTGLAHLTLELPSKTHY